MLFHTLLFIYLFLPVTLALYYLSWHRLRNIILLIAVRQVGRFRFEIWQVMAAGAAAVLLSGDIGPSKALRAVDQE